MPQTTLSTSLGYPVNSALALRATSWVVAWSAGKVLTHPELLGVQSIGTFKGMRMRREASIHTDGLELLRFRQ